MTKTWHWLSKALCCFRRGRQSPSDEAFPRCVGQVMTACPPTLPFHYSLDKVLRLFQLNRDSHFYVLDPAGRLAGRIACQDLHGPLRRESLGKVLIAGEVCLPVACVAYVHDDLGHCLVLFDGCTDDELPVLASPERPQLVGIVTRWRLLEALAGSTDAAAEILEDRPASSVATGSSAAARSRGRVIPFLQAAEFSRDLARRAARRARVERA